MYPIIAQISMEDIFRNVYKVIGNTFKSDLINVSLYIKYL